MRLLSGPCATLLLAAALTLAGTPAAAERADRGKPMVIEADRPGIVDLQRQLVVFNGNVVITQGTMVLRAERVELHERPDGYRTAIATGSAAQPASWRQRRDGGDETVEGSAERIEYDGRTATLRLSGHSVVRRLRDGRVADDISGNTIVWNNDSEVFTVEGGSASAANPQGRVRVVLSPREAEAASAPAGGASGSSSGGGNRP
ncbi:MAG: lipopolysaccharide transport periplasmic protein LptA [Rubrivivax sp.]|jgi:lipopolysaccharide export system protein LptA|nr:lipopolysaccharide transport periplasmic protein LptA [Rubrivivax sp.]